MCIHRLQACTDDQKVYIVTASTILGQVAIEKRCEIKLWCCLKVRSREIRYHSPELTLNIQESSKSTVEPNTAKTQVESSSHHAQRLYILIAVLILIQMATVLPSVLPLQHLSDLYKAILVVR